MSIYFNKLYAVHIFELQSQELDLLAIISDSKHFIDEEESSLSNQTSFSADGGLKFMSPEDKTLKRNLIDDFCVTSKKPRSRIVKQE